MSLQDSISIIILCLKLTGTTNTKFHKNIGLYGYDAVAWVFLFFLTSFFGCQVCSSQHNNKEARLWLKYSNWVTYSSCFCLPVQPCVFDLHFIWNLTKLLNVAPCCRIVKPSFLRLKPQQSEDGFIFWLIAFLFQILLDFFIYSLASSITTSHPSRKFHENIIFHNLAAKPLQRCIFNPRLHSPPPLVQCPGSITLFKVPSNIIETSFKQIFTSWFDCHDLRPHSVTRLHFTKLFQICVFICVFKIFVRHPLKPCFSCLNELVCNEYTLKG